MISMLSLTPMVDLLSSIEPGWSTAPAGRAGRLLRRRRAGALGRS
jgi:hypothetical protein